MAKIKYDKPRGILNPVQGKDKFSLHRFSPSEDIAFFVEHYWIVEWDLCGQGPYKSETLPHPSIHIVFEKDKSYVVGIMKEKFSRILNDAGIVFGIKFKPGAFYPFVKTPVSSYVNKMPALNNILGKGSYTISKTILLLNDYVMMVEATEKFLRERLPEQDENVTLINNIVERIINERNILRVEDVVVQFDISKRSLQRLFNNYVGINPKWLIKRYRLHEAAEQLVGSKEKNWAQLAVDLGYFDQAHFSKDFKSIVGKSPEEYAKQNMSG